MTGATLGLEAMCASDYKLATARAEVAMLRRQLLDLRAAWLVCGSVVYGCGTAAEREAGDRITTILGRG